jgi:hypothetical protein
MSKDKKVRPGSRVTYHYPLDSVGYANGHKSHPAIVTDVHEGKVADLQVQGQPKVFSERGVPFSKDGQPGTWSPGKPPKEAFEEAKVVEE